MTSDPIRKLTGLLRSNAKAITGNFLPEEVLRMIVKEGYSWHYPIPLPPLPDPILVGNERLMVIRESVIG